MKRCELCKSIARIYCESDQASLCWSCDSKVHSANFLVARHSRCLLCHSCQSPTPWSASGRILEPSTVSICDKCVVDGSTDDDEEYHADEDETDLDDEDGVRNQVVPWSSTPPPSASSSSGSEVCSVIDRGVSMKRQRRNVADLSFEDDVDCLSVQSDHQRRSSIAGGDEVGNIRSLTSISESMNENRNRKKISGDNESTMVVRKRKDLGFDLNEPYRPF